MDEGDFEAEEPRSRLRIDQICTGTRELGQRRTEVAYLVRDVMHAGAALRQEPAHRRVLAERLEELDPSRPDAKRRCTNTLILNRRTVFHLGAEETLVRRERRIEILDRDTQMVDPPRRH